MSDDIVTTLRRESFYRPTSRLNSFGMPQMGFELTSFGLIAADEIERLRRELGQVSDADSWVSEADAAHLDSLLNWCEFNDMESHRALQRLVNDRARLRGEVTRLRALARDIGLSPTYLSLCGTGRAPLSPAACRALLKEIER